MSNKAYIAAHAHGFGVYRECVGVAQDREVAERLCRERGWEVHGPEGVKIQPPEATPHILKSGTPDERLQAALGLLSTSPGAYNVALTICRDLIHEAKNDPEGEAYRNGLYKGAERARTLFQREGRWV